MKNSKKFLFIIFLTSACCSSAISASKINSFKKLELYSSFRGAKKEVRDNREKLINFIKIQIENEQYTEAMLELNKLLAEESDDSRIYVMSANLLRKTYQFDEAEKMAKKALQFDYKNSEAYLAMGHIFFDKSKMAGSSKQTFQKQGDYLLKSFDLFFMASQYDQTSALPHIALAEAYHANKQEQRAKDEILKAKELCFDNPKAYYEIGQYYYRINNYDKAKKYIQKALENGLDYNHRAYYIAGRISEQKGKLEDAQRNYLNALKLKPDMLEAQMHLDKLIKTSYKKRKAEETAPKDLFADVDENLKTLMKADYYLMIDEYTRARDLYIKLLEKTPDNPNAAAGLAELYYSKWREGFSSSKNFTKDALYIIKSKPSNRNAIALLKFQTINETKLPEKVRQELINLSISQTFEFYDLLNEARAEFLLENYEECHNKLYKLLKMNLSNYEKFKILKHLCYDHNYYEALIVLDDLKKTYYHNDEIEPAEKRINTKLQLVSEKLDEALIFWKEENYNKSLSIYKKLMSYFPTYKSAYLHYALGMESLERYDEAYKNLNTYYKLYKLYPDEEPEVTEQELQELIQNLYIKIKEQNS